MGLKKHTAADKLAAFQAPEAKFTSVPVGKKAFSVKEIALITGQSRSTVRRQLRAAKIPCYQISAGAANCGIRFLAEDLEAFLLGRRRILPGPRHAAPRGPGPVENGRER